MRSLMFVPAHNEKLMASAVKVDADVLILDIEDSVQPLVNKQLGRDMAIKFIQEGKFKGRHIFPRINDRESGQLLKDVMQLSIDGVDGFMYPKARTGDDIYFFDKLLETIEYEKGIELGTFKIIPLIETASAVMNVQSICSSSKRVIAIAYGSEDFITDLGGIHDSEHKSLFTPRAMIAMGARAHNVTPIDTVHVRVKDLEDLEVNLKLSVKLGFEGMLVLNPLELDLVHKYYSPTEDQIKHSLDILKFDKEAKLEGKGVAIINGKFIGPPFVEKAKKIIAKSKLIKKLTQNN